MAAFPATERIASFVAEVTLDTVPPAAVDTAKAAFMDCLGVALAGSRDGAGTVAARVALEEGAREEASVIGHGSARQASRPPSPTGSRSTPSTTTTASTPVASARPAGCSGTSTASA